MTSINERNSSAFFRFLEGEDVSCRGDSGVKRYGILQAADRMSDRCPLYYFYLH